MHHAPDDATFKNRTLENKSNTALSVPCVHQPRTGNPALRHSGPYNTIRRYGDTATLAEEGKGREKKKIRREWVNRGTGMNARARARGGTRCPSLGKERNRKRTTSRVTSSSSRNETDRRRDVESARFKRGYGTGVERTPSSSTVKGVTATRVITYAMPSRVTLHAVTPPTKSTNRELKKEVSTMK